MHDHYRGEGLWRPDENQRRDVLFERPCELPTAGQPTAGSLRLVLGSARRSGARVSVTLLCDEGAFGRHAILSVDWQGRNDLQLWVAYFLGDPGEAHAGSVCTGVRFELVSAGPWPTELEIERVDLAQTEPLWPVGPTDTVVEAGWHSAAVAPHRWRVESACGAEVFVQYPGRGENASGGASGDGFVPPCGAIPRKGEAPWLTFGFPQRDAPGAFTIVRDLDVDLAGCSQVLFKATWDRYSVLSAWAVTDGGEVEICAAEAPGDHFRTFAASLSAAAGRPAGRLVQLRFTLAERPDRPRQERDVSFGLFWVLLRRPSELDRLPENEVDVRLFGIWDRLQDDPPTKRISVPMPPFAEPPESTTPVGDPLVDGLPFGFAVRRGDLEELRSRCLKGRSREAFEAIRREADRAVATELTDRNTYGKGLPWGGVGKPKGYRGAGMRVFAPVTAFAHLVTGEERYAVACRRWMLRAVASDVWTAEHGGPSDIPRDGEQSGYDDFFTGTHPQGFWGYMDHHFWVADVAYGFALAYDMLYHCFSPAERDLVETAMAEKGLFHLWDKMLAGWDFYVRMNQGSLIALPLLMQTAFLKDRDPVYRRLYDETLRFIDEFASRPWNDEGVMGEGPSYGNGTVKEYVVETLPVLSACTGRPIEELLPPASDRFMTYLAHCRSTWRSPGRNPHFVGISDGGEYGWIGSTLLLFYARRLRDGVAEYFLRELDDGPEPSIPSIVFDGPPVAPTPPELPPAHAYRDQPMVFFRTGFREGDTLVMMNAISQVTCHGHRDRGTIIFEYGGEALVNDSGMLSYHDTRGRMYQETFAHNCLTVDGKSQLGGYERYDVRVLGLESDSGDRCPGRADGIDWAVVDLMAVYEEASRYRRHLLFLRPDTVVLYDEISLVRAEPVELTFILAGAVREIGPAQCLSTTSRNALELSCVATAPFSHRVTEWDTHWPELKAHRMVLAASAREREYRWLTVLRAGGRSVAAGGAVDGAPGGVTTRVEPDGTLAADLSFHAGDAAVRFTRDGSALVRREGGSADEEAYRVVTWTGEAFERGS